MIHPVHSQPCSYCLHFTFKEVWIIRSITVTHRFYKRKQNEFSNNNKNNNNIERYLRIQKTIWNIFVLAISMWQSMLSLTVVYHIQKFFFSYLEIREKNKLFKLLMPVALWPLYHIFDYNFSTRTHFTLKFWYNIQNVITHETTKQNWIQLPWKRFYYVIVNFLIIFAFFSLILETLHMFIKQLQFFSSFRIWKQNFEIRFGSKVINVQRKHVFWSFGKTLALFCWHHQKFYD